MVSRSQPSGWHETALKPAPFASPGGRQPAVSFFVPASAGVEIGAGAGVLMLATVSLSTEAVVSRFIGQAPATATESPRAAATARTVFMRGLPGSLGNADRLATVFHPAKSRLP